MGGIQTRVIFLRRFEKLHRTCDRNPYGSSIFRFGFNTEATQRSNLLRSEAWQQSCVPQALDFIDHGEPGSVACSKGLVRTTSLSRLPPCSTRAPAHPCVGFAVAATSQEARDNLIHTSEPRLLSRALVCCSADAGHPSSFSCSIAIPVFGATPQHGV